MIKFLDLHKVNLPYQAAFQQKMQQLLDKGWFVLGDEVQAFEQQFARYTQSKYCIGVGNGLDAMVLIFKAYIELGLLQKGDEIIVPANTYIASILAVLQADLTPVLVEPDSETFNLNPNEIEAKITAKTKGILVVHLYGQLADMEAISKIGLQHNLLIIKKMQHKRMVCLFQEVMRELSVFIPEKIWVLWGMQVVSLQTIRTWLRCCSPCEITVRNKNITTSIWV